MRCLAKIILVVTGLVVGAIVLGILLVVLGANLDNAVASFLHSVAEWLVTPFKALFTLKQQTIQVVVNWGSAAIVYLGHRASHRPARPARRTPRCWALQAPGVARSLRRRTSCRRADRRVGVLVGRELARDRRWHSALEDASGLALEAGQVD
jgi:hypothetical protein